MALLIEHLPRGLAVAIVSSALLCVCFIWLWRRMKANLAWERGLARPLVLDSIRNAIQIHRHRTGAWPAAKAELRVRVKVDERSMKAVENWDIRLVNESRDGDTARYSIMIKDSWEQWDTDVDNARMSAEGLRTGKVRRRVISE